MLISETHFTDKGYLKLSKYTFYNTKHPAGTARGGTAVIIKTTTKHHLQSSYEQDVLQATSVSVEDSDGPLTISAVYLPPNHAIKQEQLEEFLDVGSSQEKPTMLNTLTGHPDLSHSEDAKYSKQR
jgi:hypothetical protein